MDYRHEKEAFVANNSGSGVFEVIVLLLFCPLSLVLAKCALFAFHQSQSTQEKPNNSRKFDLFLACKIFSLEFVCVVFPPLVAMTILSSAVDKIFLFLSLSLVCAPVLISIVDSHDNANGETNKPINNYSKNIGSSGNDESSSSTRDTKNNGGDGSNVSFLDRMASSPRSMRIPSVSYFKGFVMLLTCIAILAVDFPVFPRRFSKTEIDGISLMDCGSGLFIVSSAMTSKLVINQAYSSSKVAEKNSNLSNRIYFILNSCVKSVFESWNKAIVLVLGFMRMIILKAINYQEHSSEYGTHWNFFVTIFFVWLLNDSLQLMFPIHVIPVVALSLFVFYQYALLSLGLTDYILTAPREDFFSSNREGLCSLFGTATLFILTQHFSKHFIFNQREVRENESMAMLRYIQSIETEEISSNSWKVLASCLTIPRSSWNRLFAIQAVLWGLWIISHIFVQSTSRRLCNISYVSLILALSLTMFAFLEIVEAIFEALMAMRELIHKRSVASTHGSSSTSNVGNIHSNDVISSNSSVGSEKCRDPSIMIVGIENRVDNNRDGDNSNNIHIVGDEINKNLDNNGSTSQCHDTFDTSNTLNGRASKTMYGLCGSQDLLMVSSLEFINRQQLKVFLLANLATGAVNLTIKTLYVDDRTAFIILVVYMYLVVLSAWILSILAMKAVI